MLAVYRNETCAFLHPLFAACANLYGTIALRDVWSVYQELKSDVPRIHRRDLIAFSSIVRREVQPYRVYEIEELYTEEPHNDLDRHIVSKELIGAGYGKMFSFYALMDERDDRPYLRQVEDQASRTGWVSPLTREDKEYFSYLRQVSKRDNIDMSKANRLEYNFVIRVAESEFYAHHTS